MRLAWSINARTWDSRSGQGVPWTRATKSAVSWDVGVVLRTPQGETLTARDGDDTVTLTAPGLRLFGRPDEVARRRRRQGRAAVRR